MNEVKRIKVLKEYTSFFMQNQILLISCTDQKIELWEVTYAQQQCNCAKTSLYIAYLPLVHFCSYVYNTKVLYLKTI